MTGCLKMVLTFVILAQAEGGRPRIMLNSLFVKHHFKDSLRAPSDVEHAHIHQLTAGMRRELKATEVAVSLLSGKHATEARRVHSLLQAATRMAHHGAVAGAIQRRLSVRYAMLLDDLHNKILEESNAVEPTAAAAEEGRALRAFASGMEQVAGVDGSILSLTKKAASRLGRGTHDDATAHLSAQSEQLLTQALRRESQIVAEEVRNAEVARIEASRLQQVLHKQGRDGGATHTRQTDSQIVSDAASSDTEHLLSVMSKAKERITGLLRGRKNGALARRLSKAIDGAERAEAKIASMESHELVQAREDIQKLQQLAPGNNEQKQAKIPSTHTSPSAKPQAMMRHVQEVLTQQVLLAGRESRLAARSNYLAAKLRHRAKALADGLHDDGDSTDQDVAAEIEKQLATAQSMLQQMAFIHKTLGQEASRKVAALRRQERKLALAVRRRR